MPVKYGMVSVDKNVVDRYYKTFKPAPGESVPISKIKAYGKTVKS